MNYLPLNDKAAEIAGKQPFRYGSLFSGIGGLDLGLDRAGMECAWQVEKDEFCRKVLTKHWPNVPKYEDVKDVGKRNLEAVNLIAGGFPCQPHSHAGQRKGAADDRDLWPDYRRVIEELRPAWVISENVPGIRTTILDQVLSDLEDMAYAWETFVIPAVAFNAPHRRDRIFIVAHAHREWESQPQGSIKNKRGRTCNQSSSVAFGEGHRCQRNRAAREQVATTRQSKRQPEGGQPVMADADGDNEYRGAGHEQVGRLWQPESINGDGYARGNERKPEPRLGRTTHGLSSGLDGYWDGDWERGIPRVATGVPNRNDRLKALGNAVVPQVAEWLGRQIMKSLERHYV